MKKIFIHGSGQKADSWEQTIAFMEDKDILKPELSQLLQGQTASYAALTSSFAAYCEAAASDCLDLCGLSLGGMLALQFTLDHPDKVRSLILIATPHKIPKLLFAVQKLLFHCLPSTAFQTMAFDKKNTFALAKTMKRIDYRHALFKIKCPVLIVCGAKDKANLLSAFCFVRHIKHAEIKIVKDCSHVVNEEQPKRLAEIVNAFYDTIR